jgi:cytochrome c oxidase subunit 3
MAHAPIATDPDKNYIPHGSKWPIVGSVSLFVTMLGVALSLNHVVAAPWLVVVGLALVAYMFFGWFSTVVGESVGGVYNAGVDRSFRMGMMWFIFSEVMFFAAFFGALFYARQLSIPWLGGEGAKAVTSLLWPEFDAGWPSSGPGKLGPRDDGSYEIIPAFGLPAINTALLLTSGLTITVAHHALKSGHRGILKVFLALTFVLGFIFLGVQVLEYGHAWHELGLQLGTGIYGSTFFMLTGFHGLHVMVGAIMLVVIWLRCMKGHFTPKQHFAFEAVAWYWHFVDVVWLGLFIFVYWL